MTYFYLDVKDAISDNKQRHIIYPNGDGYTSFPLTDDNPNTPAYEAWLSEGNTPEPWNPSE